MHIISVVPSGLEKISFNHYFRIKTGANMKNPNFIDRAFYIVEQVIYIFIALLLTMTAAMLIYNSVFSLLHTIFDQDFVKGTLHVIDRMLLTLMVVEILYTVKISYQSHTLTPEPFFVVGLIASIRRILIISVEGAYFLEKFTYHMIELGVLGFIVLIFVFSIIYFRKSGISADRYQKTTTR
jgi:uncharacterized membrane protein (DUF373 family)